MMRFIRFILGLSVGAAAGVLFAPRSGRELRERLLSSASQTLLPSITGRSQPPELGAEGGLAKPDEPAPVTEAADPAVTFESPFVAVADRPPAEDAEAAVEESEHEVSEHETETPAPRADDTVAEPVRGTEEEAAEVAAPTPTPHRLFRRPTPVGQAAGTAEALEGAAAEEPVHIPHRAFRRHVSEEPTIAAAEAPEDESLTAASPEDEPETTPPSAFGSDIPAAQEEESPASTPPDGEDLLARIEKTRAAVTADLAEPFASVSEVAEEPPPAATPPKPEEQVLIADKGTPQSLSREERHWPEEPAEDRLVLAAETDAVEPTRATAAEGADEPVPPPVEERAPAPPAGQREGGSIDQAEMRRRIEETRARLKAKAFDAMMSGESALLRNDSGSRPSPTADEDQLEPEIDATIDESFSPEDT